MQLADLRIFTEPQQGASYGDLLAVARRAEALGYGAFFRSDHFLKMGDGDGLPGPTDAWVTLGGIARETSTIRLGTLVTSATFRLPGPLAISVAQVDDMSNGRVELGLGAGWYEQEHQAYGIEFPPLGERFDRLEEQLEIITGHVVDPGRRDVRLARRPAIRSRRHRHCPSRCSRRCRSSSAVADPKRTPALAARYATEFNTPFVPRSFFTAQCDRVRAACESIDRDPATMTFSAALVLCCGADEAEFERRAAAIGREPAELRENGAAGTPDEVAATLRAWADAGADRVYLQVLDLADLDHLDVVASEVANALE